MCQISISVVTGNPISGGINILVKGTATNCKDIRVRFNSGGIWATPQFVGVDSSGLWSATFNNLPHNCGDSFEVDACCINEDDTINDSCCDSIGGTIQCPNDCCITPTINVTVGNCDNNGNIPVTFDITGNITSSNCLPYEFAMDFGDGQSTPAWGTISINSIGAFNVQFTHTYNPQLSPYNATLYYSYNNGSFINECGTTSVQVVLDPCDPIDCCPKPTVQINIKDCDDNCKRAVEIITFFGPKIQDCPYATMQWKYYDANNIHIQNGQNFNNLMSSPYIETLSFSSSQSPITAKLITTNPPLDCPEIVQTINIPDCGGCPSITSFTHTIKDCVKRADKCCRKVEFEIKGIFCGNPKIRIEYGDGNYDEQVVQNSGQQIIIFDNEYCTGGNYNVKLKVITPTGCPDSSINISVPDCDPNDCETVVPDPVKPKPFCPCCIWWILTLVIYFTLWASGLYEEGITVLGRNINIQAPTHGLFNVILILLIVFCFSWIADCKKCWQCRVARCTIVACIIALIILLIFGLWLGYLTNWVAPLWYIIPLLITAIIINSTPKCQDFWDTGECN